MAKLGDQDLNTYDEVDSNGRIVVSGDGTAVTVTSLDRDETAKLGADFGVGFFDGDFIVDFEADWDGLPVIGAHGLPLCAFSTSDSNSIKILEDADEQHIRLYHWRTGAGILQLYIQEWFSGSIYADVWGSDERPDFSITADPDYFYRWRRVGDILSLESYDVVGRIIPIETIAITLNEVNAYRFFYSLLCVDDATGGRNTSGYIKNINITIPSNGTSIGGNEITLTSIDLNQITATLIGE